MKVTLKNKEISPLDILINFFASVYDIVYYFFKFLLEPILKLALKIKKTGPLNLLILFFASLYDMVYYSFKFLLDYAKWITDIQPLKSPDFVTHTEQLIPIHS
jgi:hypothetical protein